MGPANNCSGGGSVTQRKKGASSRLCLTGSWTAVVDGEAVREADRTGLTGVSRLDLADVKVMLSKVAPGQEAPARRSQVSLDVGLL